MMPYHSLSVYWKGKFGTIVRKVPLDAGFSCPNRDGTLSSDGCVFCNEQGSGTGLSHKSISIKDQYYLLKEKVQLRQESAKFAAYLQSYSNTYCSPFQLSSLLEQLMGLDGLSVLCVGTRPDCLDREKAEILASFPCDEVWLDLGLQSSCDETLARINRGHSVLDFSRACRLAASAGLLVCAHVIAGLPGEDQEDFLRTIDYVSNEPIRGVKIHNLYVCRNTALASMWEKKQYKPLEMEEYAGWVVQALARLRQDIIIHRLTGDPAPGELLAPEWAGRKSIVLDRIRKTMVENDLWQGKTCPVAAEKGN